MGNEAMKSLQIKHQIAARCLAEGLSREVAAEQAGIGLRTLERYLADQTFREMVNEYRQRANEAIMSRLDAEYIISREGRIARLKKRLVQVGAIIDEQVEYMDLADRVLMSDEMSLQMRDLIKIEAAIGKQIAQEKGEWQERIDLRSLTDEQLAAMLLHLDAANRDGQSEAESPA